VLNPTRFNHGSFPPIWQGAYAVQSYALTNHMIRLAQVSRVMLYLEGSASIALAVKALREHVLDFKAFSARLCSFKRSLGCSLLGFKEHVFVNLKNPSRNSAFLSLDSQGYHFINNYTNARQYCNNQQLRPATRPSSINLPKATHQVHFLQSLSRIHL
jgi:hypothetical protein